MNTIKKSVSVLLAVMMIFSMLAVVSVSAAETTSTITVSSNVCDPVEYTYDENDSQVEVTYFLQSDKHILNTQAIVNYDSNVLALADTNTPATAMPVLKDGSAVINFKTDNAVKFNATTLNLYDFTSKGVFFTLTFDIIGSGNTTVDLDLEILTASLGKNYDDVLAGAEDYDLVYFDTCKTDEFTVTAEANLVSAASGVAVTGDIALPLEKDGDTYTGSIDLQAGTYKFNIDDNGTTKGFNFTFTDATTISYAAGYKAPTTLIATGGRYEFVYSPSAQLLKVRFKPFSEIVELFGDINVQLVRTSSTSTVFTGSARVEAGTYTFKINDQGVEKGFGYTFDDVVFGAQYSENYKSATTFIASGGIYSVQYDSATSKLTFMHAPAGLGEVRVFGDFNLDLARQGENLFSAQTTLEAGTYQFRVDSFGKTLCNGSKFADTIGKVEYKADWKAATEFTATAKMKFTFIFDSKTNTLAVYNAPIDTTKVLVAFENSNLELTSKDGVNYTATTTLAEGTYSFRMDVFGVTMCFGGTATDKISGVTYSSQFKSATNFNATGGDYTFTFNVKTNQLFVTKG